ncbi:MFS transporter [Paucibacter sp. APW11]|uniref:MFS transporter n=1 Tax=Roseateles aquae TaxID=3077235 RepID=A0ABU3PFT6_9BURK|nr:MFS transporter [Paucibacter sp. APW11]MDT9001403.1 MFS transporter [Paucibacter sp. APW11]
MRLPNLLGSKNGRLAAFFLLYVTEGIPLGFATVAVATQLRRMGVGPAEIGAFVGSFYIPWAFKWAFGPFIDVFRSKRWGHRRAWIIATQVLMAASLMALVAVPLPAALGLFTTMLLVHNTFGGMQDVAIDSLACNTLAEDERGLANGLMFAGASLGQAIGGSGVLFLMSVIGFQPSFVMVAAAILAVTVLVVLPMKEAVVSQMEEAVRASGLRAAGAEMRQFAVQSFRSFIGSEGAFSGVFFALLPAGAMALGLALQSNLAVEFGMDDDAVAWLNLWTMVVTGLCMVIGGYLSDKLGRRLTLFVYTALMSVPVIYLWAVMRQHGYDMPRPAGSAPIPELISALWLATISYSAFNGLMYGTRAAAFMDVTNPRVAATQFTAYMAMGNLAIAIAATWQGVVAEAFGYQMTLLIDAVTGVLSLALLHKMKPPSGNAMSDAKTVGRARKSALVLGLCCLAWLPCWAYKDSFGEGLSLMQTFFTLVFVSSGLFLLAAREVLGREAGRLASLVPATALLLLLIYLRKWMDGLASLPPLMHAAEALLWLVPLLGGLLLIAVSRLSWQVLEREA